MSAKTVKVRIPVAVDSFGAWRAEGNRALYKGPGGMLEPYDVSDEQAALNLGGYRTQSPDDPRKTTRIVFIEAEVEVPERAPEPPTVQAETCPTCFRLIPAGLEKTRLEKETRA